MRTHQTHTRGGGFSMMELAIVLVLLSIFSMIAGKLFFGTFKVMSDSRQAIHDISEFDHAVRLMRADVWAASRIDVADTDHLELDLPDGVRVQWLTRVTVMEDQQIAELIRSEHDQDHTTESQPLTAPLGLGFEAVGHDLRLTTDTDSIVLSGTRMLLQGARP